MAVGPSVTRRVFEGLAQHHHVTQTDDPACVRLNGYREDILCRLDHTGNLDRETAPTRVHVTRGDEPVVALERRQEFFGRNPECLQLYGVNHRLEYFFAGAGNLSL